MNVFTIILRRISTGETAPTFVVRRETEAEARAYGEQVLLDANATDLVVHEVRSR
jgi:hypothetical protein